MTASWNSTGEVGWPTGEEAQDQEPFRSDWSSFEDSLREHGFEVAPPAVEADAPTEPATDGWTSDGVRQAAVEDAAGTTEPEEDTEPATAENAEPVAVESASQAQPSGDQAAPTDASNFWSFETEETTWIVADAVDDRSTSEAAADGEEHPGAETAGPETSDSDWLTASGDDDADAPVLADVGEPLERAPMSVFGDEQVVHTAGAVYSADETSQDDTPDRWWTEPADSFESTPAVANWATDGDENVSVEASTADEPALNADAVWAGHDTSASENTPEPYVDPTRGAHAPQTLPDDRLPTPPPDLFANFARRGAAAAVVADNAEGEYLDSDQAAVEASAAPEEPAAFVPWTYEASDAAPATEAQEQPVVAAGDADGQADGITTPEDTSWSATNDTGTAEAAGWSDWSSVAEPAEHAGSTDTTEAVTEATSPTDTAEAVTEATSPTDAAQPAVEATDLTDTAEAVTEATSPTDATSPADAAHPALEATDAEPASVPDDSAAPADGEPANGMAVDWYEAAAIEAVGTSTGDELSNTEFVGYDAATPAAAAVVAGPSDDAGHDGATDHADATGLAEASAAATLGRPADIQLDGHEPSDDDHPARRWAVLGAAAATDDWQSPSSPSHEWQSDDEWPEATATDAAAATDDHDHGTAKTAAEGQEAVVAEDETAEPVAAEAVAASVALPEPDGNTTDVITPDEQAWPMPEPVDWDAADQDAWSTPASAKSWNDSESAAAAAAVAATSMAGGPASAVASPSISASVTNDAANAPVDARAAAYTTSSATAGSGLFSRYDTSPAMTVGAASAGAAAATGATTTSPRGESDLWHLVSEPSATAPTSTEKRSFDPVTVFLTVLVAIIIVALLLGLLYTVAPMLTGAAH